MFEFITQIDYEILMFIQEHLRFDWLTEPMVFISHLGNMGLFWIVLCLSLLISKRTRKMGICGLIALILSGLVTNVALKSMVARIRPYEQFQDLLLLLERQSDFSFPSGHSSSSFAAACALYWASDRRIRRISAVLILLAGVIAWSRLYVAVHFPTDVLAGTLIGILCGWLACRGYARYEKGKGQRIDQQKM